MATEKSNKKEELEISILLAILGEKGQDIHETFAWDDGETRNLAHVLRKFDGYCEPRSNESMSRFQFFNITQRSGTFTDFVTNLQVAAADRDFRDRECGLVRDMIIKNCSSRCLRERLLRESDLTMVTAIKMGRAEEESKRNAEELSGPEKAHENALFVRSPGNHKQRAVDARTECSSCGLKHGHTECIAKEKVCFTCGEKGH
ncbi:MAG: hypothetical protein AAF361_02695 [Bacteroidota bacterium]